MNILVLLLMVGATVVTFFWVSSLITDKLMKPVFIIVPVLLEGVMIALDVKNPEILDGFWLFFTDGILLEKIITYIFLFFSVQWLVSFIYYKAHHDKIDAAIAESKAKGEARWEKIKDDAVAAVLPMEDSKIDFKACLVKGKESDYMFNSSTVVKCYSFDIIRNLVIPIVNEGQCLLVGCYRGRDDSKKIEDAWDGPEKVTHLKIDGHDVEVREKGEHYPAEYSYTPVLNVFHAEVISSEEYKKLTGRDIT